MTKNSIVKLDVGGQKFTTTRETLLSQGSHYFARLLDDDDDDDHEGRPRLSGAIRDEDGTIFMDRPPDLFKYVLLFLRNNHLDHKTLSKEDKELLKHEAIFYGLDKLVEILEMPSPSTGYDATCLSDADQRIRDQAQEARNALLTGDTRLANDLLMDLFPQPKQQASQPQPVLGTRLFEQPFTTSPTDKCTILFDKHAEHARQQNNKSNSSYTPPANLEEFKHRLRSFCGPLMDNFPMEDLFIAGGAVLQCLMSGPNAKLRETDATKTIYEGSSDIDLFLIAKTQEGGKAAFDRILKHLCTPSERRGPGGDIPHHQLLVVRSPFAVTFCIGSKQRHFQLILQRHQCIAEVLLNFDIDCCQVAWDGERVLATPSALRALQTGINIADPKRCTSSEYEHRLVKYAERGFLVAVPGLVPSKIKEDLKRNCCYTFSGGHLRRVYLTFQRDKERPDWKIGEEAICGLAKLIVASTICTWTFEEQPPAWARPQPVRRFQDGETRWVGNLADGSLGSGNFLLSFRELKKYQSKWEKETPPYKPPVSVLAVSLAGARFVDTVGDEILPMDETPRHMLGLLNGNQAFGEGTASQVTDDTHEKRLVCYDLIQDVRSHAACTNVLDANRQFPHYQFVNAAPGRLTRNLEFQLSTTSTLWAPYKQANWTDGVYQE